MNISLKWLKEFVTIPKHVTPDELGRLLTIHTVEVESVINEADRYKNVVIGKIKDVKKHPQADRLQLAKVDVGHQILDIVCGAPNIAVGQLVPTALAGAILPNGMEIKEAEVRGEKSHGMLCAEDELGLGEDHSGILIIEGKYKPGQLFSDYLKLHDTIFEIDNKSLSNRPDLWCHRGIAREVSAILGTIFVPGNYVFKNSETEETIKIRIEDQILCPRYMAVEMGGITIEPSPDWMREKLLAIGLRPINNIVDITNYVNYELGQPMHAFDRSKIDEIIVRRAGKDKEFETLDGKTRVLEENTLVIADSSHPIAIAGVMGGANSEISDGTTAIVFESANFNASSIRKTSTRLGLRTDASVRYEKSLDPNLCEEALARAVELVLKICPNAKVTSKTIDIKNFQVDQGPIEIQYDFINERIGADIKHNKIEKILTSLGFGLEKIKGGLKITIPTWRATKDVSISEDIVEEIARVYGFNEIPSTMPLIRMSVPMALGDLQFVRKVKNILAYSAGLTEVYNYSFVGEEQLKKIGVNTSGHLKLSNPLASNQSVIRRKLSAGLIENIKTNQAKFDAIAIFEIGKVFNAYEGNYKKENMTDERLPYQDRRLGIAIATSSEAESFDRIKGVISLLFEELNLNCAYAPLQEWLPWMDEKWSAQICLSDEKGMKIDKKIGTVALLKRSTAKNAGVKKAAAIAEIYLDELYDFYKANAIKLYQEPSRYPALERDLAFVISRSVTYLEIKQAIFNFNSLVFQVELFDVYEGDKIGRDKKSLAFHISYQADRTLTSEEVDAVQAELFKEMEDKFGAVLRNF